MRQLKLLFISLILLISTGCSSYLQNQLTDSLSEKLISRSSNVFQGEEDPILLGDSLPFMIKMLEVLVESSPENINLKATTVQTMMGYGKAWLEYEANLIEEDHYDQSEQLKYRAKRLYLRAKNLGIKGIKQKYSDFFNILKNTPDKALLNFQKEDVPLLTGTGLAWILWISHSTQSPIALSEIPDAMALLNRAFELSPEYNNGQLYEFFIRYYTEQGLDIPDNKNKVTQLWEDLQNISKGRLCSPYLTWATSVSIKTQNQEEFKRMLNKALAVDFEKYPELRLSNELCRRETKLYLKKAEDLFL